MKSLLFVVFFCALQIQAAKKYKVKLVSLDRCKIPEDKYDKSETVVYYTNVRKVNRQTTLISANFTIKKTVGPLLFDFKMYQFHNNMATKDLMFKLDRVDCHNPYTYQIFRLASLKTDTKCMVAPGYYKTSDIDVQDFAWILTKMMATPGRYIYNFEVYLNKGVMFLCHFLTCDISEAK